MTRATRTMLTLVSAVLLLAIGLAAQKTDSAQALLRAATDKATVDGDLNAAITQYQAIVDQYAKTDHGAAATALLRMAEAHQKLGDARATTVYERLVRDYGDQREQVAVARGRLAALQPSARSQTTQVARQIWAGNVSMGGGGRPSPDGRYLSFTERETGDLAVRDLITNTNRRVTNTGGWVASGDYATESVISPDGRQVAYEWFVQKEFKNELRVASIATDELVHPKVVLRTERNDYLRHLAWTPDGKQLVVLRSLPDRINQIGIITIQDGSFRNIKSLEWRDSDLLSLSPDGRYVAYDVTAGEAGSPHDIFVLATDGSRETAVVKSPANDSFPLWSPDGSQLLFLSDRTGSNALWAVPIQDGRPNGPAVSIKTDIGSARDLMGITKSGTLYYFVREYGNPNLWVADLDAMHATTPPVPATERFINANFSYTNFAPTWSRDGEYLAYYSFRDLPIATSIRVLVIRSAKTGEERTVPLPARVASLFAAGPKWFPDNRSVLVLSGDAQGSGFGFYRLALDTGNTELLAHLPENVSSYDLSPDGRTIIYFFETVDGLPKGRLMRFDIESQRETELRNDLWCVSLAISPDGLQVATTLGWGVVEVTPAAGGQSREVFRPAVPFIDTGQLRNNLAWTPDQRFLLFVQEDGALWKVPALGGEAEKVGISMGGIKSPAVRPDGKQIVFGAAPGGGTREVWALENFLPALNATK